MINKLLLLIPKPKKLHIIVMIISLISVAFLTNNYQYGLMSALFLGISKETLDGIVKRYPKLKKYTKYIGVNGTGFNLKDICLWDMIGIVFGTAIYYLIKLFI